MTKQILYKDGNAAKPASPERSAYGRAVYGTRKRPAVATTTPSLGPRGYVAKISENKETNHETETARQKVITTTTTGSLQSAPAPMSTQPLQKRPRRRKKKGSDRPELPFVPFEPRVRQQTHATTTNIQTLVDKFEKQLVVPEAFQRPGGQWNDRDRSGLIESLLLGYPIGEITIFPDDATKRELIVDGQQRITTIVRFVNDELTCLPEKRFEYTDPEMSHWIAGKSFTQLHPQVQQHILNRLITFSVLPSDLSVEDRIQIFLKINVIGKTLSHQDLRMAIFGGGARVEFLRLAGVTSPDSNDYKGIVAHARTTHDLTYPWASEAEWRCWWGKHAIGQAPSETILMAWQVRHHEKVARLITQIREGKYSPPGMIFKDRVQTVMNIICATLAHEEKTGQETQLASLPSLLSWFNEFQEWFLAMKKNVPKTKPGSRRKIAMFLGLAPTVLGAIEDVTSKQWNQIAVLLTGKRHEIAEHWGEMPQIRGKWSMQLGFMNWMRHILETIADS